MAFVLRMDLLKFLPPENDFKLTKPVFLHFLCCQYSKTATAMSSIPLAPECIDCKENSERRDLILILPVYYRTTYSFSFFFFFGLLVTQTA